MGRDIYNQDGDHLGRIDMHVSGDFLRAIELKDGTLLITGWGGVTGVSVYKRAYRTMAPASGRDAPPLPSVISAVQRSGTTWMDIDYKVIDADTPTVHVAALAFANGGGDLGSIVKMRTFEENTATNLGASIAANETHHLTWNVASDWNVDYSDVQVEILAKDDRNLMDFHYITIPSNSPDAELTINRSPITDADMLSVWMWLVATNDASINLSSVTIYGVEGIYSNVVLATGTSTTSNGVNFLFERMKVERATNAEVTRAKEASTPGMVNQWKPRSRVGDLPNRVNEYGFDTGGTGYWVKPLP
jgi:hypothetical protein